MQIIVRTPTVVSDPMALPVERLTIWGHLLKGSRGVSLASFGSFIMMMFLEKYKKKMCYSLARGLATPAPCEVDSTRGSLTGQVGNIVGFVFDSSTRPTILTIIENLAEETRLCGALGLRFEWDSSLLVSWVMLFLLSSMLTRIPRFCEYVLKEDLSSASRQDLSSGCISRPRCYTETQAVHLHVIFGEGLFISTCLYQLADPFIERRLDLLSWGLHGFVGGGLILLVSSGVP